MTGGGRRTYYTEADPPIDAAAKQRFVYLKEFYFGAITPPDLFRRLTHNFDKGPVPHEFLLGKEKWGGIERSVRNYLELGNTSPRPRFVSLCCRVFARHWLQDPERIERVEPIARGLEKFVITGEGSPFLVLHNYPFECKELTYEHEAVFEDLGPGGDERMRVLATLAPQAEAVQFLKGNAPRHLGIVRDVAIAREAEDEVLGALNEGARIVVLTGAAGDGKTTIMARVGMRLRSTGARVLLGTPTSRSFPPLPDLQHETARTVLLIDNADHAKDFKRLEADLLKNDSISVVLAARDFNWTRRNRGLRKVVKVEVAPLNERETRDLANVIHRHSATRQGRVPISEIEDRIARSVVSKHKHMLAAMIAATEGKSFESYIESLIADFKNAKEEWVLRAVAIGMVPPRAPAVGSTPTSRGSAMRANRRSIGLRRRARTRQRMKSPFMTEMIWMGRWTPIRRRASMTTLRNSNATTRRHQTRMKMTKARHRMRSTCFHTAPVGWRGRPGRSRFTQGRS